MGRVTWKNDNSKAGQEVLRGYLGDIPAYTVRDRADGKSVLTDRLQMTFEVHDTEAGARKAAENAVMVFLERIGAQPKEAVLAEGDHRDDGLELLLRSADTGKPVGWVGPEEQS